VSLARVPQELVRTPEEESGDEKRARRRSANGSLRLGQADARAVINDGLKPSLFQ
jgi:hypothetical protein